MSSRNLLTKIVGVFGLFVDWISESSSDTVRRRDGKRRLSFETLESRELLSGNSFDNNGDIYSDQFYTADYNTNSNDANPNNTNSNSATLNNNQNNSPLSTSTTSVDSLPTPIYLNQLAENGNSTFSNNFFQITDTNTVNSLDQLTEVTVAARFKLDNTNDWHYILTNDVESNRGYEFFARTRGDKFQFGFWNTQYNTQAEATITANTWYDFVGTYDGTDWKIYLNGELVSTQNDPNRDFSTSNVGVDGQSMTPVWLIGAHGTPTERRYFAGEINFVAVYDTALTADAVEELFEEKDNWNVNVTVPTSSNNTTAAFSESTEESFNVSINRTNNSYNADKSYAIDFKLTFSGATKDDFEIYCGDTLISNNDAIWSDNYTTLSYTIPANETSVVLTFKILNDAIVEGDETLEIAVSDATGTVDGAAKDFDYDSDSKSATIIDNDWNIEVSASDSSISESVSENEDEADHYLTFTFSRGDEGDLDVPVTFDFKLSGTAKYSEERTDFWLYDEDDNEIILTYDATEDAYFGQLTIAAGESEVEIKLKPRDNIFYEPDETVTVDVIGVDHSANDPNNTDDLPTYTLTADSSSSATITISTEDTLLYPIPEEDRPELPPLFEPMSIGLQDFDLDPTTLFTPLVSGTYWLRSEGERTVVDTTEDMSIKIISLAYVNGDWEYYEIITWNYDTINTDESEHYWGTFTYIFYAWDYDGSQGFTFTSTTTDEYDLTLSYDNTDPNETRDGSVHQWGESEEQIDIESNYSDNDASDVRTITSTDNLSASGSYSYDVEGGSITGTFSETEYYYEYSSTDISLTKSGNTWTSTGSYNSESSGETSSEYDGEGEYTIDETTAGGTRYITGTIIENGSTSSEYSYTSSGTLANDTWTMTGDGSDSSEEESYYQNDEIGEYETDTFDVYGNYVYSFTTETINYSDDYSFESSTDWSLSDGVWEVSSGTETEEAETSDYFKAETNAYTIESGASLGTRYYELTETDYYDKYDVTRSIDSNNEWTATSGDSETEEFEKYQSDVMVETETYTRQFENGTISGTLGWIQREYEEFEYESESEIVDGEWELQSGTGRYEQETYYGDFARGTYTSTNPLDNTETTTTESWKNLNGTNDLIEYIVNNNEWTIDDETTNTVDLLEYLHDDSPATIPTNYRTITVASQTYNNFEDYFVCVNANTTINSVAGMSDDNKDVAMLIEAALRPVLRAKMVTTKYLFSHVTEGTSYEINVAIVNNVATVILASHDDTIRHYYFPPGVSGSTQGWQVIGRFNMELGTDGLPEKNTIEMAKYLISLFKSNPIDLVTNNICLNANMTKVQVRQLFKQVTDMTAVEDMFIGLKQATERQELKDYIDAYFDSKFKDSITHEFTELAQIANADKLYEKLMTTLVYASLNIVKKAIPPESSGEATYESGFFRGGTITINSNEVNPTMEIIHELLHAYVDLISGKPLGQKQDEGMVHALTNAYLLKLTPGIYKSFSNIEVLMDSGDQTTAKSQWDILINGDNPTIDNVMKTTDYAYKFFGARTATTTKDDFKRLEEYTGFGLSRTKIKQYAEYLNTKYSTDIFTVDNKISY
jgi:hypothetical protein